MHNRKPKLPVFVIIPVWNRPLKVKRALDSVLKQTLLPDKIWVIDDGSDVSLVPRLFSSPHVQWIRLSKNKGVSFARNVGLRLTLEKGESWICFLDSDDIWHPLKLEKQLCWMQAHPDMKVNQTGEIWIREGKRVHSQKKHAKPEGWIFKKCVSLCCITPSTVLLHSSVIQKVGFFDETFPACEDYDYWIRLSHHFPVGLLQEALATRFQEEKGQLSLETPLLDRYRVRALLKILKKESLSLDQRDWVLQRLKQLSNILSNGALKRGFFVRAKKYSRLLERIEDLKRFRVGMIKG